MTLTDQTDPSQGAGGLWGTHMPSLGLNPPSVMGPVPLLLWCKLRQRGGVPVGSAPGQGRDAKLGRVQGWDAKLGSVLVAAAQQLSRHFCRQPAGRSTAARRTGAESPPRTHPTLGAGDKTDGSHLISQGFPYGTAWGRSMQTVVHNQPVMAGQAKHPLQVPWARWCRCGFHLRW